MTPPETSKPVYFSFFNRNLFCLFSGQIISQMGDSMYQIGLMWLVLDLTGSKSAMGIVAMISYLPMLLFGLFAGILVDTFNRRRVMMVSDLLRAAVVLFIPVTFFMGVINLPVIMAVSFVVATFSTVFNPARDSILPDLVPREYLIRANSFIQVSGNTAIFFGPILGGLLIGMIGVVHLFTIDALTFFVSFIAIFLIRHRSASPGDKTTLSTTLTGKLTGIARYIRQRRRLRFLLGLTAVNNFFIMGPAIVGPPIFVKDILHGDATDYALVESSLGLGMLAGSVFINWLARRWNKGRIWLWGLIFDGITHVLVYFTNSLELFMALIAFHAIGIPAIVVSRTSLIQEWVESSKLGRVFSLVNISVVGVTAITTAATGWLAEYITIDVIFGVFGAGGMMCGIVGWFFSDVKTK